MFIQADVICIDEAHFFDSGLVEVGNRLADSGKRIIVAGLDMDFKGCPFGPVPGLTASAEFVNSFMPCVCAAVIWRITATVYLKRKKLVLLGEKHIYEPLCRECYWDLNNNS